MAAWPPALGAFVVTHQDAATGSQATSRDLLTGVDVLGHP